MPPLVVRCSAFGEMVLLTALLKQLHVRFGRPVDVISSGPWTRPLLADQPGIGTVMVMRSRKTPYWVNLSQQRLVRWLRERGPGPTWCGDATGVAHALLTRAGVPDDYVCDSRVFPWVDGEHFVDRWIRFGMLTPPAFEGLLPQAQTRIPSAAALGVSTSAGLELDRWLAQRGLAECPYIAIQAGNKRDMRGWLRRRPTNTKYWPETRWGRLLHTLHELHPECAIVLLGVRQEHRLNADIARLAALPCVYNVAGDVPISILLPLLQRAVGMIAVDTGPAHAAAALGCPTVALFGTADPRLYRPGGTSTPAIALTGQVDGKPSMLGITVEAVVAAWMRLRGEVA